MRRRIVEPVVTSLLSADELDHLEVWATRSGGVDEVWVRVVARGESFRDLLDSTEWGTGRDGGSLAARLADHLEDWISETAFAWGQQRTADYTLPEACPMAAP